MAKSTFVDDARRGSEGVMQVTNDLIKLGSDNKLMGACFWGCVGLGRGLTPQDVIDLGFYSLGALYPEITYSRSYGCPKSDCSYEGNVSNMCLHLNDDHLCPINVIADWVEGLDLGVIADWVEGIDLLVK